MTVQAMKLGAIDFLTKASARPDLAGRCDAAIKKDIARRKEAVLVKKYIEQLASLTQESGRSSVSSAWTPEQTDRL